MGGFPTRLEQAQLLRPVARILWPLLAGQLLCGLLSAARAPYGQVFVDFWAGAALATFPAFLAGLCWQRASAPAATAATRRVIAVLGGLCLLLTGAALLLPLERIAAGLAGR